MATTTLETTLGLVFQIPLSAFGLGIILGITWYLLFSSVGVK